VLAVPLYYLRDRGFVLIPALAAQATLHSARLTPQSKTAINKHKHRLIKYPAISLTVTALPIIIPSENKPNVTSEK